MRRGFEFCEYLLVVLWLWLIATVNQKRTVAYREVADGGRSLNGQQLIEFQMRDELSSVSLKPPRSQPDVVVVKPISSISTTTIQPSVSFSLPPNLLISVQTLATLVPRLLSSLLGRSHLPP